jgi:hypothetical protein
MDFYGPKRLHDISHIWIKGSFRRISPLLRFRRPDAVGCHFERGFHGLLWLSLRRVRLKPDRSLRSLQHAGWCYRLCRSLGSASVVGHCESASASWHALGRAVPIALVVFRLASASGPRLDSLEPEPLVAHGFIFDPMDQVAHPVRKARNWTFFSSITRIDRPNCLGASATFFGSSVVLPLCDNHLPYYRR